MSMFALVALALVLGGCGGESTGGGDPIDPVSVVASFNEAFNDQDLIAAMEFFANDAVMTGHPFQARAEGIAELTRVMREDMANAASTNSTKFLNFSVNGGAVTFDHIYHDSRGECFSGSGYQIVVEEGRIVRYDWGTFGEPCD